jgi:hypothetical protein
MKGGMDITVGLGYADIGQRETARLGVWAREARFLAKPFSVVILHVSTWDHIVA